MHFLNISHLFNIFGDILFFLRSHIFFVRSLLGLSDFCFDFMGWSCRSIIIAFLIEIVLEALLRGLLDFLRSSPWSLLLLWLVCFRLYWLLLEDRLALLREQGHPLS